MERATAREVIMSVRTSKALAPALSLGLLACMFTFGPHGVSWFWADHPGVALVLAAMSAAFWVRVFARMQAPGHSRSRRPPE